MLMAVKAKKNKIKDISATVHDDFSSRVQTVTKENNLKFYNLLQSFFDLTGIPVLLNTSFNIKGQPIVNTPQEAIKTFLTTKIDILVIDDFILNEELYHTDQSGSVDVTDCAYNNCFGDYEINLLQNQWEGAKPQDNIIIANIYGCEIIKNDRKFKEICKKEAAKIISVKIKLLKKNSELYFSIEINLITKFIKTFQIYFVLIFLKRSKSS